MKFSRVGLRASTVLGCLAATFLAGAAVYAQQTAVAPAAAPRPASPAPLVREMAAKKVTAHVWVISDNNVPMVPNVGIVVGTRATLVIDPGMGVRNGQAVLRAVAKLSKNSEMYVMSTHYHPESASGVAAFPASAKYVVSQAQQRDLTDLAPAATEQLAKRNPGAASLLKGATYRKADISFDKTYELDLGGVKATLMAVGPTHTRGDTAVWVQDEKDGVIFAGDVLPNQSVVSYSQYSSTKAWMDALAALARLRPANDDEPPVVVPGEGPMADANLIAYQRGFFQAIQARVRENKEKGTPEPEAFASISDEMKGRFKFWKNTDGISAVVANAYQEMR